jgi:hypothetical protein
VPCDSLDRTEPPRRVAQFRVLHLRGHIRLLGVDEQGAEPVGLLIE